MRSMSGFFNIIRRFAIISVKKVSAYQFELWMTLIQLLFNLSFTVIFWYTLLQFIPAFAGWEIDELLLYTSMLFLGEGISGIFFGFRDMPERILQGELDKFLTRPVNVMAAMLFENVSVLYFIEQICVSVLMVGVIMWKYRIAILVSHLPIALLNLILGVITTQLIIGVLTFLSFWFGRIENLRNLFLGVLEVKEYPITIFPRPIRRVLTYTIPVYFAAYYPCALLIGKEKVDIGLEAVLCLQTVFWVWLFGKVWKMGLRRYEANGG
ncbi:MAG: ABC transporter permease [Sellimonas sp.]|uniref:ABC transporter permease n=1 Tax=Sellimonas sp. TaxID=2021466 RepID=UPI00399F6E48